MYKTCRLCNARLDAGERCDCVEGRRPCARCGAMVPSGEHCRCVEHHPVLIAFPDGSRVATYAEGSAEEIKEHYRDSTAASAVYFVNSRELVRFNRKASEIDGAAPLHRARPQRESDTSASVAPAGMYVNR